MRVHGHRRPGCTFKRAHEQKINSEWGSTHWALMKSRKKLLPWQLPAYIFRRTQISCLPAIVLFWLAFDRCSIPRWIISPLARLYPKSWRIRRRHLCRQKAVTLKIPNHGLNLKVLQQKISSTIWGTLSLLLLAEPLLNPLKCPILFTHLPQSPLMQRCRNIIWINTRIRVKNNQIVSFKKLILWTFRPFILKIPGKTEREGLS